MDSIFEDDTIEQTFGPLPPWIPCQGCDDYFCTIHEQHAHECDCPPVDEWEIWPYFAQD